MIRQFKHSDLSPALRQDDIVDIMITWPDIILEIDVFKSKDELIYNGKLDFARSSNYKMFFNYDYPVNKSWVTVGVGEWFNAHYGTFALIEIPFGEQRFKLVVKLDFLLDSHKNPVKATVSYMIHRSSWLLFNVKDHGEYIEIPSINLAIASESYNDSTPPWDNILGTPSLRFKTPALTCRLNESAQKTQLAIDVGSFGNVVANVRQTGRVVSLLAAPIHDFDIKTTIQTEAGVARATRPIWSTRTENRPNFPSIFIKANALRLNESMSSAVNFGELAEKIISSQGVLDSEMIFQAVHWSAKSYVGDDDFITWATAIAQGIKRRISLPRGIARDGLLPSIRQEDKYETMILGEPSKIFLSYPSTWMHSQRTALQDQIAKAFELSRENVDLVADEATAGAFGWLSELIGTDADPGTTLSLLSSDTLFLQSDAPTIQGKNKFLKQHLQPCHILVIDSGAGTTDISLIRFRYDSESNQIYSETIARQGFIAGGLELSKMIVAEWKKKIGNYYEDLGFDSESVKRALCTLVDTDQKLKETSLVIEDRTQLLLAFHNLAEITKRCFTTNEEIDLSQEQERVMSLIQIKGHDNPDLDELRGLLTLSLKDMNRICAQVLGASIIGAVDLPIQYGVRRLDQIFLLGRTLRLPGVVNAFIHTLKEKIQQMRQETGQRWDDLMPSPGQIYAWSRDQEQCRQMSELSLLNPNLDKNAVVSGLALIARARRAGVQAMKFRPYDQNFRQRFVGVGRMESWYWRYDLLSGALPGQKPEEFEPDISMYSLRLDGQGAEDIDIMWNNLGRSQGMALQIGDLRCVVPAERGYRLGRLQISEGASRARLSSMVLTFTLIEDGRVALRRVDAELEDGSTHTGQYTAKIDIARRLTQTLKVAHASFFYEECRQDVDYRDTGYVSDVYDVV